jgi:hypothetical protein
MYLNITNQNKSFIQKWVQGVDEQWLYFYSIRLSLHLAWVNLTQFELYFHIFRINFNKLEFCTFLILKKWKKAKKIKGFVQVFDILIKNSFGNITVGQKRRWKWKFYFYTLYWAFFFFLSFSKSLKNIFFQTKV